MNGFAWQGWPNPWRRLREMERDLDRLFGDYGRPRATGFPPVNAYADENGVAVTAELPGVDPKELDITVHDRVLVLRGERKAPDVDKDDAWLRRERTSGPFARSVDLPFEVDPEKVEATYRDGVLEVKLQRSEATKPKQIKVNS